MKLKTVRENMNLSQGQLSKITGVSVRTLQHYEQGSMNINNANLKTLVKLCIALDCKLIDIVEDEELIEMIKAANIK